MPLGKIPDKTGHAKKDTLQLVLDARDDDEKAFFEMLGNYLLQKKQKEVIESNLF